MAAYLAGYLSADQAPQNTDTTVDFDTVTADSGDLTLTAGVISGLKAGKTYVVRAAPHIIHIPTQIVGNFEWYSNTDGAAISSDLQVSNNRDIAGHNKTTQQLFTGFYTPSVDAEIRFRCSQNARQNNGTDENGAYLQAKTTKFVVYELDAGLSVCSTKLTSTPTIPVAGGGAEVNWTVPFPSPTFGTGTGDVTVAGGVFSTLKAGKTYVLEGNIRATATTFGRVLMFHTAQWYDVTAGQYIGAVSRNYGNEYQNGGVFTGIAHRSPQATARHIFTPSVDTQVELRARQSNVSGAGPGQAETRTNATIFEIPSDAEYIIAGISVDETVLSVADQQVPFDSILENRDISLSGGVFDLKAGKIYELSIGISGFRSAASGTGSPFNAEFRWYNLTAGEYIGEARGQIFSVAGGATFYEGAHNQGDTLLLFAPEADTQVELRMSSNTLLGAPGNSLKALGLVTSGPVTTDFSHAAIMQVGGFELPPTPDEPDIECRGWGRAPWGRSSWGGIYQTPSILPLQPADDAREVAPAAPLVIRYTDPNGIDPGTIRVQVNGVNYVINGSGANGATAVVTLNDFDGVDVTITLPFDFVNGQRVEIYTSVTSLVGEEGALVYYFLVGTDLRLVQVLNPSEGTLVARFNGPMLIDDRFLDKNNWAVIPLSPDARELTITGVSATVTAPDVARLSYIGGGSTYQLTVNNVIGQGNVNLAVDMQPFDLIYGSEDPFEVKLFDSIFGPIGIAQRVRRRRTIDSLVVNRSMALGINEQTRLKFQQLDNTAGRNGRPGKLRT